VNDCFWNFLERTDRGGGKERRGKCRGEGKRGEGKRGREKRFSSSHAHEDEMRGWVWKEVSGCERLLYLGRDFLPGTCKGTL
jgi:hypothetical protein